MSKDPVPVDMSKDPVPVDKQRDYDLNSFEIQGYGTPMY